MGKERFKIILEDEALEFIESQDRAVANKIYYNIHKIANGERDAELFKKLTDSGIWEFRTLYNKTAYRLFSFWDKEDDVMIVATHGIEKKTQKTPAKEIKKAEAIMKQYFEEKHKKK